MKFIPQDAWIDFKKQYVTGDIKDIAQGLLTTLIVLVPSSQIEIFKNCSKFEVLQKAYFTLVRQHTDAKITSPESITMYVESKEDFDAKYQGSWYNYFS